MTKIQTIYQGNLNCELIHSDNGEKIFTTAPKDNGGTGDKFSPTDLFAASLSSCVLTVMGLVAKKYQINLDGCRIEVEKEMALNPRRIGRLALVIRMPAGIPADKRPALEEVARNCPVYNSLRSDIIVEKEFIYADVIARSE